MPAIFYNEKIRELRSSGRRESVWIIESKRKETKQKLQKDDKRKRGGKVDYMSYVNAFWVGGLICALAQILMEKTKMLPGRIMVLLVCLGAVLSFVGLYQPFVDYAGAGASVPLMGFGNTLMKGVKEMIDEKGFIGIFMGGFQAGAVGCCAALVFGYLASLIFKPHIKK